MAGREGVDGLAGREGADGLAVGREGADGLALADGDANDGEEVLDEGEDDLEDVGVEGDSSGETGGRRDSCDVSFVPATHSQSMVLLRSRTTLAFKWKDPEASPP